MSNFESKFIRTHTDKLVYDFMMMYWDELVHHGKVKDTKDFRERGYIIREKLFDRYQRLKYVTSYGCIGWRVFHFNYYNNLENLKLKLRFPVYLHVRAHPNWKT